jgi:hypothetical protein
VRTLSGFVAAVAAVGVVVCASPARADEKAEKEARALFKEGNKALDDGNYPDALDMFKGAYARWPNPKILLNMGTALRALGRYAEAADTYEKYLADSSADPKKRPEVQKLLDDMSSKVGKIHIEVNEPGARVLVDGKVVGQSPQTVTMRVDAGTHAVVAEKEGFALAAATISVGAGEERVVQLRLVQPNGKPGGGDTPIGDGVGDMTDDKGDVVARTDVDGDDTVVDDDDQGTGGPTLVGHAEPMRSKLAAVVRGDMDVAHMPGGAGLVGASYAIGRIEPTAGLMRAGENMGLYLGANYYFSAGKFRPFGAVGLPMVFADGAKIAVHFGAGAEYDIMPRVGLFLIVGAQYFTNAAEDINGAPVAKFLFTPSAGLHVRL